MSWESIAVAAEHIVVGLLVIGLSTREMVVEVWLVLYQRAKEGQMAAIKEFLDRTCGKAEDDELQARVEQLEPLLDQYR